MVLYKEGSRATTQDEGWQKRGNWNKGISLAGQNIPGGKYLELKDWRRENVAIKGRPVGSKKSVKK